MKKKSKIDWQSLVEEWPSSGLSKTEYCKEKNISREAFYRWYKVLNANQTNTPTSPESSFMEVFPEINSKTIPCIKITTSYGLILEIPL